MAPQNPRNGHAATPAAPTHNFRPSAYFYRQAFNASTSRKRAVEIGRHLADEYERLEQWVRDHGLTPPAPRFITGAEVKAQGLATRRSRAS